MNISFVIPTYNSKDTLVHCISSVVRETENGDEIIIVDNGSSDNSLEVASNFSGVQVYSKTDCNVSAVRNYGVSIASCCLIAFVDSDCILKKGWRWNAIDLLKNKNIHATGCKYEVPENSTNWIEKIWFAQRFQEEVEVNYINSGNFVINRDVFEVAGGFNEELITGEDAEFCFRLRSLGYRIVSSERIGAIHLGNPKNILDFYKKQYWHSLGMFGTFRVKKFDKPLIATFLFIFSTLLSLLVLAKGSFLVPAALHFCIPVVAALFRYFQYRFPARNFCLLIVLYYIYFWARSFAFINIFYHKAQNLLIGK